MPSPNSLRPKRAAPVFAALGDETRLRLIVRLCGAGPHSIRTLTKGSRLTRQAITKHLRTMQNVGLVRNTRQGRESFWRLDQRPLEDAGQYLNMIGKQWDAALVRLSLFFEEDTAPPLRSSN